MPHGSYEIRASKIKYYPSEEERIRVGYRGLTLVLEDLAVVSGIVLSARTDMPLTEFEVLAVGKRELNSVSRDEIASSEDGWPCPTRRVDLSATGYCMKHRIYWLRAPKRTPWNSEKCRHWNLKRTETTSFFDWHPA